MQMFLYDIDYYLMHKKKISIHKKFNIHRKWVTASAHDMHVFGNYEKGE